MKNEKGFSMIELLIAIAMAAGVAMAGYAIFSSSGWSQKIQEDVAEAQQNIRIAADRLSKDIRVAGFGLPDPPFSLCFNVGDNDTSCDGDDIPLTAPITVVNSTTGFDTITLLGVEEEEMWLDVDGDCSNTDTNQNNNCNLPDVDDPTTSHPTGSLTLNVTGDDSDAIDKLFSGGAFNNNKRYISIGGTYFATLSNAVDAGMRATLTIQTPATGLDRAYRDGTPVYIIRVVRYTINTALTGCSATNPCLAREDFASTNEVLAENIEDMQFAYGIDVDPRDGRIDYTGAYAAAAFQNSPADPSSIIAVRMSIVARTRNQDPRGGTNVSARPALEDFAAGAADGFRRRTLTKIIRLRNPRVG